MTAPTQPNAPASDPFTLAAQAQGQAGTANVNQQTIANRANQDNPFGSSTWSQDPTTGQWTQKVGLTGQQGDALQSQQGVQAGRSDAALGLLPGATSALGSPIDSSNFSKLFSFGAPGQTNQQAEDAVMGQLNPMLDQRRKATETQLANQGITRGSEAWTNAQDQLARDENNARLQGVQAGFKQGGALDQENINYGNYQAGQRAGQFGEARGVREQGLTDIDSLLHGQGVQAPTFGQYGQAGVAGAPNYLGASQSAYNSVLDANNASADKQASLYKGLFGLGGAFLGSNVGQQAIGGAGNYLSSLFNLGGSGTPGSTAGAVAGQVAPDYADWFGG